MFYKFKCENCGDVEIELPVSKCNLNICPACNGKLTRVFSGLTPIWKCNGDYNSTRK